MALDSYHHGVRVVESSDGTLNIKTVSTSIIGVVCTAKDADPVAFPLNTPVLCNSLSKAIGSAGKQGTLRRTLSVIDTLVSTTVIIVRVDDGDGDDAIKANLIGGTDANGRRTGMQALLDAESLTGVKPRILAVPELSYPEVATALGALCKKLRAFGYVHARGCNTAQDAIKYRDLLGVRELMVIWPSFDWFDTATAANSVIAPEAFAVGLRAQIDKNIGWHKTLSNVVMSGPLGIEPPVSFDLQDSDNDAGLLNAKQVTTLVRYSGFRFWGSRTCDQSSKFVFENYTRTAQILADTIAEAEAAYVDATLTPAVVKDILSGINNKLRSLVRQGYLMGGKAWMAEDNSKEQLADGRLRLAYDYTPVPPLEDLGFTQTITDEYLADFTQQVAAG